MFFAKRSFVSLLLLVVPVAATSVGCKDKPTEATQESASAANSNNPHAKLPTQTVKVDPIVTKTYRAEACYFGTLSLKQARSAYMGSLGAAEPGPGKIPDFGAANSDAPPPKLGPAGPTPSASPSAKAPPAPSAKPAAPPAPPKASGAPATPPAGSSKIAPAPGGSADAKAGAPDKRLRSIPYERFARSCTVAAGIKTPAGGDLDTVLTDYAPFVVDLAKNLSAANMYYQKEDFKTDDFAQGKTLHQKIVDGFKKLDEFQKKLDAALTDFKSKNAYDQTKWTDTEKLSFAAQDASRDVFLDFEADKLDAAKLKADVEKADAANNALKKWGDDHKDTNDPFVRIVAPSIDIFVKQAKDMSEKDAKTLTPGETVALTTYFTRILEGNNRAVTRALAEAEGGAPGGPAMFRGDKPRPRMAPGGAPPPPAPAQE